MINTIKGVFGQFQAVLSFDPSDVTSMHIQASLDASSINTRQPQRDEHLRSDDFLHAEKYPAITFHSTGCVPAGEREYELTGNLTLRGVTKPVTFHTVFEGLNKDPRGRERAGFHSIASIERDTFGLTFNSPLEKGGMIVGNEMKIELNIEAIRIMD
jgi:polyisoprenoid-binding protein YceI